jgi:hypothetical protein
MKEKFIGHTWTAGVLQNLVKIDEKRFFLKNPQISFDLDEIHVLSQKQCQHPNYYIIRITNFCMRTFFRLYGQNGRNFKF